MPRLPAAALLAVAALLAPAGCKPKEPTKPVPMYAKLVTEDVKVGAGPTVAEGDLVLVQYSGKLAKDGSEFDNNDPERSVKNRNPLSFTADKKGQVIEGMWKGVIGMKAGGERVLKIPYDLAYGEGSSTGIPPYSDLIFEVKLLAVVKKDEGGIVDVEDKKVGTGPAVKQGDQVTVHYVGRFVNGRVFDDTRKTQKEPVKFKLGNKDVISGFEKGIEGMQAGGVRVLTIPPGAAWGPFGHDVVPGNQILVYEVDLISVKPS